MTLTPNLLLVLPLSVHGESPGNEAHMRTIICRIPESSREHLIEGEGERPLCHFGPADHGGRRPGLALPGVTDNAGEPAYSLEAGHRR
jgi:hypothetical protein